MDPWLQDVVDESEEIARVRGNARECGWRAICAHGRLVVVVAAVAVW